MGRIIFFIQEALRAMRRNGAPSVAAIITTVVTVVLLGVLIPIFQTTQAKSNEVRGELNIQAEVFPDATRAELVQLRETLRGVPHVAAGRSSSPKPRRCANSAKRSASTKRGN